MQTFCEGEGRSCKHFVKERVGHAKKLTLLFTEYVFPMELPESTSLTRL